FLVELLHHGKHLARSLLGFFVVLGVVGSVVAVIALDSEPSADIAHHLRQATSRKFFKELKVREVCARRFGESVGIPSGIGLFRKEAGGIVFWRRPEL